MSDATAAARRDELLDRIVDHVVAHGLKESSQRQLAAALGIAHNNLTHHFGTRDQLLAQVFTRLQERSQSSLSEAEAARGWGPAMVDRLLDPDHGPTWIAFLETVSAALRAPDDHREFLRHVSFDWVDRVADEIGSAQGREIDVARATLAIAVIRGLAIDLASGGDRARIEAATMVAFSIFEEWGEDRSS